MLEENNLTYEEFIKIIETVGWKKTTRRQMEIALKNSLTVKYVIDGNVMKHGWLCCMDLKSYPRRV